jgi:hypothetical protein
VQQQRERVHIGNRGGLELTRDRADDGKRGCARLRDLARQRDRIKRGIDLEQQRLVAPVQVMRIAADTLVGVLGAVVVPPRRLQIAVAHGPHNSTRGKSNLRASFVLHGRARHGSPFVSESHKNRPLAPSLLQNLAKFETHSS